MTRAIATRLLVALLAGIILAGCIDGSATGAGSTGSAIAVATSSSSPTRPSDSPAAEESAGLVGSAAPTSTPTSEPTPTRTAAPTATPAPDPAAELAIVGVMDNEALRVTPGHTVDVRVTLTTRDLDRSRCKLVHAFEPDSPKLAPSTTSLSPLASQTVAIGDGHNEFRSSCPSSIGTLSSKVSVLVVDGAPERCANFALKDGPISVNTLDELNAGIVGSWHGCVTTPWVPAYWVTMSFRANGTYSATGVETLDDVKLPAMYYGTDPDDPAKVWSLNDLQDNGTGIGTIDIVFADAGSVNRDDLRQVRLMGDELRFEMFHHATYGPLVFELIRD